MADALHLGVEIEGADFINAVLNRVREQMGAPAIREILVAGAMPIVNQAKINLQTTPSRSLQRAGEPISETGELTRSVGIGGEPRVAEDGSDIGGEAVTDREGTMYVGSGKIYAPRVELGFIGVDSLGRRYHQEPNPWLYPALVETRDESLRAMANKAAELLARAAGAGGAR